MRTAVILGVGLHPFGRFPDEPIAEMTRVAILNALKDAGVGTKMIEAAFCGTLYGSGISIGVANEAGIIGVPIVSTEQACASSAVGLRQACLMVEAGVYDMVLAFGFEKMGRGLLTMPEAGLSHYRDYENLMGLRSQPIQFAWAMRRYMKDYGATREQIAQVAVKAHRNAVFSPEAQHQKEISLEEVLSSRMICDPLTLYQCCPTTHGAAAAVVCSEAKARQFTSQPIRFAGWGATSNSPVGKAPGLYPGIDRDSIARCARQAYDRAGVAPQDVDVVQVHDPFTISEVEAIEELGFCPVGEGARYTWEGRTEINGDIPVNTDGGTQAFGHPVGATGLRQTAEIVRQLRGQAGQRQVAGAKVGLAYNQGGGGTTINIFLG